MRKINPSVWFFVTWLLLQTLLGQWKYISMPPEGMHQGAQADRACVAWNYYHESMDFFKPRVMENRAHDGITGMEFPVVNYTAAVFYKLFGPNEIWYRLVVFTIVTFGVFAAWLISGFFVRSLFHRLFLVFGWYLSPIMVFYSANFIPDPVAMSFSLIAWYFFIRFYFNIKSRASLGYYILFTSLAGLIKITFLIGHFSIALLFIFYRLKPHFFPQGFPKIKKGWIWFLTPFAPVMAWYGYSRWLTNQTGNTHFLQQMNPAQSVNSFIDNTRFGFNTWQDSMYSPNYIYIILIVLVLAVVLRWKQSPFIGSIFSLLLLGFGLAFILFNTQFRYHDYYYVLLYPALFFGMLFVQQVFLEQKTLFAGILPIAIMLAFFYLPFNGFFHSKKMLAERHQEGDYYAQDVFTGIRRYPDFYNQIKHLLPENAEIVSAFDVSPNTSLYFLRHKGIRIAPDFSPELSKDIMNASKASYLVLNDSLLWEQKYEPVIKTNKRLLYKKGILYLFQLYPQQISN